MRNRIVTAGVLLAAGLIAAACAAPGGRLSPRDQLLITCDGLAATMGIVKNFILDGTIDHPQTLRGIRDASLIVEAACFENTDHAAALDRLAVQSVILLEARMKAEAAAGTRS